MVGIVWMVGMVCKSVGHGMFDMTVCMVCTVCMVTMMDMECFLCKVGMVCVACMFGIVCIVGVVIMFHMYCMRGVYDRYDRYGMYGYYDGCYLGTQPIGGVERRRTGPYIYTHIILYIYNMYMVASVLSWGYSQSSSSPNLDDHFSETDGDLSIPHFRKPPYIQT